MRTRKISACILLVTLALTSCVEYQSREGNGTVPKPTKAAYTVGGDTSGTGEATVVSGIPSGEPKYGATGGGSSVGEPSTAIIVILTLTTGVGGIIYYTAVKAAQAQAGAASRVAGDSVAISRAKYDALSKMEGATHFDMTSMSVEAKGSVPFYLKEKAVIHGRGLTITGPQPVGGK